MLKPGGYITMLIAIGPDVGLFWGDKMFEVTGIGKDSTEIAKTHSPLPYLLIILMLIVVFIFGMHGFSADNKFGELPYLKSEIIAIAGIYLLRIIVELIF